MKRRRLRPRPALLTACAVGPDYRRPKVEPPASFRGQSQAEAASLADQPWWEVFGDAGPQGPGRRGPRNNFDVRVAAWRVDEYPGPGRHRRIPAVTPPSPPAPAGTGPRLRLRAGGRRRSGTLQGAGRRSWELDLWGRLRRLNEGGPGPATWGPRTPGAACTWPPSPRWPRPISNCGRWTHRLEIARSTTRPSRRPPISSTAAWPAAPPRPWRPPGPRPPWPRPPATIPDLERQIQAQENLLCFLVGRNPGAIPRGADLAAQPLPPTIPAGLPSTLLERRPDLREAEERLVAANAAVGVAQANYFPTLSLTGPAWAACAPASGPVLRRRARNGSSAPPSTFPVFQGTRASSTRRRPPWPSGSRPGPSYQAAVTGAFGEVSTLLVAYQKLAEVENQQAQSVAAYQEAVAWPPCATAPASPATWRCWRPSSSCSRPRTAAPRRAWPAC